MDLKRSHANTIDLDYNPKYSASTEYLSTSIGNIPKLSRDESLSSKSSIQSYLLPYPRLKSVDLTNGNYPRTEKTRRFVKHLIETSRMMLHKYEVASNNDEGAQSTDYNKICSKLDERVNTVQKLLDEYDAKDSAKEQALNDLKQSILDVAFNKSQPNSNFPESQAFSEICREMCYIESTLESFSGRLQFQVLDLESMSKINAFDMFELSIKSGVDQKFKTRIKIERTPNKNALHQTWDSRTFTIFPLIDDELHLRFSEVKTLNKSNVLVEKTLTGISDLISASPNIFTIWVTPMGTIKLKFIVQWNGMIENNRPISSNHHPSEEDRLSVASGRISPNSIAGVRKRDHNSSSQRSNFRHSANLENLSRYMDYFMGKDHRKKKNLEIASSVENITEVPGEETLARYKEKRESSKQTEVKLRQPPLIKTDDEYVLDANYISMKKDPDSSIDIDMPNIYESQYNQSELSDTENETNKSDQNNHNPEVITSEINILQSPIVSDTNNSNIRKDIDIEQDKCAEDIVVDDLSLDYVGSNSNSVKDDTKNSNETLDYINDNSTIDTTINSNEKVCTINSNKAIEDVTQNDEISDKPTTEDEQCMEINSENEYKPVDDSLSKEVVNTKNEVPVQSSNNYSTENDESIELNDQISENSKEQVNRDEQASKFQNEESEIIIEISETTNQNPISHVSTNQILEPKNQLYDNFEEIKTETNDNSESVDEDSSRIVSEKEIENALSNLEASFEECAPENNEVEIIKPSLSEESNVIQESIISENQSDSNTSI